MVGINHSLREGLGSFLREIVSNPTRDGPVSVLAQNFFA